MTNNKKIRITAGVFFALSIFFTASSGSSGSSSLNFLVLSLTLAMTALGLFLSKPFLSAIGASFYALKNVVTLFQILQYAPSLLAIIVYALPVLFGVSLAILFVDKKRAKRWGILAGVFMAVYAALLLYDLSQFMRMFGDTFILLVYLVQVMQCIFFCLGAIFAGLSGCACEFKSTKHIVAPSAAAGTASLEETK